MGYGLKVRKELNHQQRCRFDVLFRTNERIARRIAKKKLYVFLDTNLLQDDYAYTPKRLDSLYAIANSIGVTSIERIRSKLVDFTAVTIHNAHKLLEVIDLTADIEQGNLKVEWGIGNSNSVELNMSNHYTKHCLSSCERQFWLDELNGNVELLDYIQFPIIHFYSMTDVVVHTDGKEVYISGFKDKFFIISKIRNSSIHISSCYYVESGEKPGRMVNLCYHL